LGFWRSIRLDFVPADSGVTMDTQRESGSVPLHGPEDVC